MPPFPLDQSAAPKTPPCFDALFQAPFAWLGVVMRDGRLASIDILESADVPTLAALSPPAREVLAQLTAYFADPRWRFSLPLALAGTPYQQRVWASLQEIGAGSLLTYGQLAARLGSGPRAVGGACRANPVPIVVPCHRVVGVAGLTGYMGKHGLAYKEWLLAHEGADAGLVRAKSPSRPGGAGKNAR